MPIRFRCAYCDQLLGIAHRKAGTVVKCPNCSGQVVVPKPDKADDDSSDVDSPTARAEDDDPVRELATVPDKTAPAPQVTAKGEGGMLFERSDFDELLKPALERRPVQKGARSSRRGAEKAPTAPNAFDFNAPPPAPAPPPVVPAAGPLPAAPAPVPRPRSGILLTPVKLVLLAVFVIVGMGFAFGGGLLVGMLLGKKG